MRELKFRGQCIASGQMIIGGGIDSQRDTPLIISQGKRYHVRDKTIGQFTGLQDKNGVDIFEGDVVKDDDGYNREVSIGPFGVDAEDYDSGDYYEGQVPDTFPWSKFEVIGNIHQSPELLEK